MTVLRKFRYGDRVRFSQSGAEVWMVVGDDTDKTPVHDPEPAYKLQGSVRADGFRTTRYAYDTQLVRAPAPADELAAYCREPDGAGVAV